MAKIINNNIKFFKKFSGIMVAILALISIWFFGNKFVENKNFKKENQALKIANADSPHEFCTVIEGGGSCSCGSVGSASCGGVDCGAVCGGCGG